MKKLFTLFAVAFLVTALSLIYAQESGENSTPVLQYYQNISSNNSPILIGNGNIQPDAINLWVLTHNGYVSSVCVAPINTVKYQRCEYLIRPSEMLASGYPSGATINSIGFQNYTAGVGGTTLSGTLTIWLMNTTNTTYTLGTSWTTSGFTQVHSGTFTPPITSGTIWDVAFSLPAAFTYTGGGVYVAWQFSYVSGTVGTTAVPHYVNTLMASPAGRYGSSSTALPTSLTATSSRPQTRFGNTSIVDIISIQQIYTLERVPTPYGTPTPIGVYISNVSGGSSPAFTLSITVKDVATSTTRYSASLPVAALGVGLGTTINFPGWTPIIQENVNITASTSVIAGETFTGNNTKTISGNVNDNLYSYNYSTTGFTNYGFTYPSTGLFGAKFTANGSTTIFGANIVIGNNAANSGNTIYAVLLNSSGTIITQSSNYTIVSGDLGTNKSFNFPTPQTITSADFYLALAQTAGTAQWYPLGVFPESPPRGSTFYTFPIGGGTPTADGLQYKYGIEASLIIGYCTSTATSTADDDVGNVTFGTINNGVASPVTSNPTAVNMYTNFYNSVTAANIEQGSTYPISVSGIWQAGAYTAGVSVYIDFDKSGTFEAGEGVYLGQVNGTTNTITGNITIPAGATPGNTRMRVILVESGSSLASACGTYTWGETEDYRVNITAPSSMSYVSSAVTQTVTTPVYNGTTNNQIIGIQVVTSGSASPLNVSQLNFDVTSGTTSVSDIQNAKVFYTGASSTFATGTQFGSTYATIPSYPATFSISSGTPQTLLCGTNFFWLTYDVKSSAIVGNLIDAKCNTVTVSSINRTPSPTSVSGTRTIASWHYGGPMATYYFANSTSFASGSPSQPQYNWFDTSESINLIINSIGTPTAGSIDDGYFTINLPSGMLYKFMGTNYTAVYIGTNGYVTFGAGSTIYSVPVTGIPSTSVPSNGIFGLFCDIRYDQTYTPYNRLCYKFDEIGNRMIITFQNAPTLYSGTNQYVSFQMILNYSESSPVDNSPFVVQFDDAQSGDGWKNATTGQYYTNSLNHIVGLQGNGTSGTALQYRFVYGANVYAAGPLISSPVAIGYGANNGTLPVELTSFDAVVHERNINLNWVTNKEINNKGFDLERKTQNDEWLKITFKNGKGNTNLQTKYSFEDKKLNTGKYFYRLKQIDMNGNYKYYALNNAVTVGVPAKFNLSQNYPNPFNPVTKIDYDLPYDSKVNIVIYDVLGREVKYLVKNENNSAGYYTVELNAVNLASSVYFYRITATSQSNGKNFTCTKRMILIK